VLFEILIKNCLRLHEKRTSPPRRDLTIIHPRSRLVGLEFSHINAVERAGPPIVGLSEKAVESILD
jgi:hypothetical protein